MVLLGASFERENVFAFFDNQVVHEARVVDRRFGYSVMASIPFRRVAKEGRRLPSATKEEARGEESELAGDPTSSGVASPEVTGLSEEGVKRGDWPAELGPCRHLLAFMMITGPSLAALQRSENNERRRNRERPGDSRILDTTFYSSRFRQQTRSLIFLHPVFPD